MDSLYTTSLELTAWLQNNYPQLRDFFIFVSLLGNEEFYLAVLPAVYWSINKRLGIYLGFVFFVTVSLNTVMKQAFRGPRPFWIAPELGISETAGYGIPSGHVQYATVLYLIIAAWTKKLWVWLLAFFLIFVMAISRIYLAQHFLHDTVAAFIFGLIILAGYFIWRRTFTPWFSKRILGQKLLAVFVITFGLALLYVLILILIGEPDLSANYSEFIVLAEISSRTEMATAVGALLGFGVGIFLEASRVRFRSDGSFVKRVARYLVGIIVTIIIWQGLGIIFPRDPLWLAIPLRIMRYGLVTFWASYLAPITFIHLHLADADPPPKMDMKL